MTVEVFDIIVDNTVVEVEVAPIPEVAVSVVEEIVAVITVEGPPGERGLPGTGVPVVGQIPAGAVDGVNTVFTTAQLYRTNTIAVYLNGLRESHFTETTSTSITLGSPPLAGDEIIVDYVIQ